jgi:hypothetical protein
VLLLTGAAAAINDRGQAGGMHGLPDVEAQIRAAQARGDFDDLPGKGKPLKLPEVHDPNWWIKSKVQREGVDTSVLVHPTIALRREADTFPESLAELTTDEQVRAVLEDFNRRVVAEWRRPITGPSLPVVARQVAVEPMIERWRALRAQIAEVERAAPAGTSPDAAPNPARWWRRAATRLTERHRHGGR